MISIKNILVPTDCSELSRDALEYAVELAHQTDAKITMLLVVPEAPVYGFSPSGDLPDDDLLKKMNEEAILNGEKALDEFMSKSAIKDSQIIEQMIVLGETFERIMDVINKEQPDLVVMGTHGRTGYQHIFMGSVAEKVVRYSNCAVLTVKHKGYNYVPFS